MLKNNLDMFVRNDYAAAIARGFIKMIMEDENLSTRISLRYSYCPNVKTNVITSFICSYVRVNNKIFKEIQADS